MEEIAVEYLPYWRKYENQVDRVELTDAELGKLVRAMSSYQFHGQEPENLDGVLRGLWASIRDDLDHARARYIAAVTNGKKGGRKKKKPDETEDNPTEGISISESITESKTITESISNTETESSASADAEVSVSKKSYGEFGWVRLSDEEYTDLTQEMGVEQLQRCITYIDQSAQSTGNRNHWVDWHTVLRRCYQNRWYEASHAYVKQEIPMGASGYLGEAELEAIQRVLGT